VGCYGGRVVALAAPLLLLPGELQVTRLANELSSAKQEVVLLRMVAGGAPPGLWGLGQAGLGQAWACPKPFPRGGGGDTSCSGCARSACTLHQPPAG
jgi:hypothetical protein